MSYLEKSGGDTFCPPPPQRGGARINIRTPFAGRDLDISHINQQLEETLEEETPFVRNTAGPSGLPADQGRTAPVERTRVASRETIGQRGPPADEGRTLPLVRRDRRRSR